jgi:hypothetical protein
LKEEFRVHFPVSKLIDDSYDNGQGQQNLGICERIKNRGGWILDRRVLNNSKIRWALSNLRSFKSAGTNGILPILLQQRVEHVVPHRCYIFSMFLYLLPEGKLK